MITKVFDGQDASGVSAAIDIGAKGTTVVTVFVGGADDFGTGELKLQIGADPNNNLSFGNWEETTMVEADTFRAFSVKVAGKAVRLNLVGAASPDLDAWIAV